MTQKYGVFEMPFNDMFLVVEVIRVTCYLSICYLKLLFLF